MICLRNLTAEEQWIVDPLTGIGRKVEPHGLAHVNEKLGQQLTRTFPKRWEKVEPIALGPGPGDWQ